jgi:hypothetical protein
LVRQRHVREAPPIPIDLLSPPKAACLKSFVPHLPLHAASAPRSPYHVHHVHHAHHAHHVHHVTSDFMRTLHGVCPWLISLPLARIMQQAGACLALRLCCYSTDYLPLCLPAYLPTCLPAYLPLTMYPRPLQTMQQAGTCLALRLCCYSTDYLPTYQPTNLPTYLPTYYHVPAPLCKLCN